MSTEDTIDLDSITASKEATQKVGVKFDDDGNPTAGFVIVGKDSHQYRSAEQRLRAAALKRQAQKSQRIDSKTDEGSVTLARLIDKNDEELAVAVVVDWFGFTSGGAPATFTTEAVRKAFQARPSWREKVSASLENEAGFTQSSPTN